VRLVWTTGRVRVQVDDGLTSPHEPVAKVGADAIGAEAIGAQAIGARRLAR
jgi:hypothetical protein